MRKDRMRRGHKIGQLLVALFLLLAIIGLAPKASEAAGMVYVSIPGIPGDGPNGVIQGQALEEGVLKVPTKQADFAPIHFVKHVDKATPRLLIQVPLASIIPVVTIKIFPAFPTTLPQLTIQLKDVTISSVQFGIGSDGLANEGVDLTFRKIKWTYDPGGITEGWDLNADISF